MKKLWWQKYRPNTLENYIFQNDSQKQRIEKFIKEKSFPHLLFYGIRGSGKSTLTNILINEIIDDDCKGNDVLTINGSDESGIDVMRNAVKSHISSLPMGEFKLVVVDEADGLSSKAQEILRGMMEEHDHNSRFIFTCNYVNKLSLELRSRFNEFKFTKLSQKDFIKYGAEILINEDIELESDEDFDNLKQYADLYQNDLRKFVIALEVACIDGKLTVGNVEDVTLECGVELVEMLNKNDWMSAREMIAENIPDEDLIEIYRFLYNYLHEIEKFKNDEKTWKRGIVILSDYMYRHALHPDSEINFAGCMIKLSEV